MVAVSVSVAVSVTDVAVTVDVAVMPAMHPTWQAKSEDYDEKLFIEFLLIAPLYVQKRAPEVDSAEGASPSARRKRLEEMSS